MAVGDFVVLFLWSKQMEEEERARERRCVGQREAGLCRRRGGRNGRGSDPIHISGIWPENELVLFFFFLEGG